jgi:plastocyanin domain-containing protein
LAILGVMACTQQACGGGESALAQKTGSGEIVMSVTEKGFEPDQLTVQRGTPVKLLITRKTDQTCAKQIVVDEYAVRADLPLNVAVHVAFTPTKSGTLRYGCAMDKMVGGVLTVQ